MIKSHSLIFKDFKTQWYKKWAKELKQDKDNLENFDLLANKFWQNAVLFQTLWERGVIKKDSAALGFGVGQERLPALFAKHGLHVTATDQDFKSAKAGHWSKHELAIGTQPLNRFGICDPKIFSDAVEYMSVDMSKIPKRLYGKYDIVWSNCALGHLGSIPAGLTFIEQSLNCLKKGGWAVHTTELNILSNTTTVDSGSTVVFRLKDIYNLQKSLLISGYLPVPFKLTLGKTTTDQRVSMRPTFGNGYSKIQVMGHLATQINLIIGKPNKLSKAAVLKTRLQLKSSYLKNQTTLHLYRRYDPVIKPILKSQRAGFEEIQIVPVKSYIKVAIQKGKTKEVVIDFKNTSSVPLFGMDSRLDKSNSIVLATNNPRDRASEFADKAWRGTNRNRAATDLWVKKKDKNTKVKYELADYIKPHQDLSFKLSLNTNKLKKGTYKEEFSIVQEHAGWIEGSQITIEVRVS